VSPEPIVVIQTQPDMPPGLLSAWARARSIPLDVRRVDRGDALPDAPAGVAILGSDADVNDVSVPWMCDLRTWTAEQLDAGVPTLGISFGAQLVAQLLGATVVRAAAPQRGWVRVASADPWLAPGPWLAWHRDVIVAPDGLRVSARNRLGVQAFTAGPDSRHLGVQFRPEATTAMIAAWAQRDLPGDSGEHAALNAQTAQHCASATAQSRALFDHWAVGAAVPRLERLVAAA
jgi:GMP synthase (glutamine-hydrolysing)